MFVSVFDRPLMAEMTEAQDRALMETKSATIHRKLSAPAPQLPITGFAHKAGIVGHADRPAGSAALDMAAQYACPAQFDRAHHPPLDASETAAVKPPIRLAVAVEDIRHLQPRRHGTSGRRHDGDAQSVERACRAPDEVV